MRCRGQPLQLVVEAGRIGGRADLHGHAFVLGLLARLAGLVERLALEIDDDRVAVAGDAVLDRLEARRAFAQPLERLIDGRVVDRDRRPPHLDRRELAGIERRHDVELGLEGERLPLFELDVTDVRRVDRLDAAFGAAPLRRRARPARARRRAESGS